jgi:hypothetical protein
VRFDKTIATKKRSKMETSQMLKEEETKREEGRKMD